MMTIIQERSRSSGGLRLAVAGLVTAMLASIMPAMPRAGEAPEVELVHWWISPGEAHAVDLFREEVERRGGVWKAIAVESYLATKTVVSKRLQLGMPPTLTQWISGSDLMALHEINKLGPMPQTWRGQPLKSLIFEELWEMVQDNGVALAIPVGMHMQNYALHNAAAYAAIHSDPPASWRQFLELAPRLKDAGYVPIATSSEDWQIENLFITIVIDLGGVEAYRAIHSDARLGSEGKILSEAFSILRELRGYALEPRLARNWAEVTAMVADGRAATAIMGDFAKGDMVAAGLNPGTDFLCTFAPGNQHIQLWAADVFVPLNLEASDPDPGVALIMDVIMDPAVQAEFARRKGALPVRKGIPHELLGPCERDIYAEWEAHRNTLVPLVGVGDSVRVATIRNLVKDYWDNPVMSPDDAATNFMAVINEMGMP
ncbi:MAG: carbohydrate ABC transporter substrate-binding protein [Geminicoccaceae bacterium]|nr:carbohydrate ABC transporter substrate-binding protein [Geminicoccaceae bacterium]